MTCLSKYHPTPQEGVAVLLDVALKHMERDKGPWTAKLM